MIYHSRNGIGEKALLLSGSARKLLPPKSVHHKGYHEGYHESWLERHAQSRLHTPHDQSHHTNKTAQNSDRQAHCHLSPNPPWIPGGCFRMMILILSLPHHHNHPLEIRDDVELAFENALSRPFSSAAPGWHPSSLCSQTGH